MSNISCSITEHVSACILMYPHVSSFLIHNSTVDSGLVNMQAALHSNKIRQMFFHSCYRSFGLMYWSRILLKAWGYTDKIPKHLSFILVPGSSKCSESLPDRETALQTVTDWQITNFENFQQPIFSSCTFERYCLNLSVYWLYVRVIEQKYCWLDNHESD